MEGSSTFSYCTEAGRDLRRDIEVTDGEVDHVLERREVAEATGAVLHDLDDPV